MINSELFDDLSSYGKPKSVSGPEHGFDTFRPT